LSSYGPERKLFEFWLFMNRVMRRQIIQSIGVKSNSEVVKISHDALCAQVDPLCSSL